MENIGCIVRVYSVFIIHTCIFTRVFQEKGSGEGLRLTKLEVARVLRERNEYKEKYLSLLEQVRYTLTLHNVHEYSHTTEQDVLMYMYMHNIQPVAGIFFAM